MCPKRRATVGDNGAIDIAPEHHPCIGERRAELLFNVCEHAKQPVNRTPRRAGRCFIDGDGEKAIVAPVTRGYKRYTVRPPLREILVDRM